MRIGERKYGAATLTLGFAEGLPPHLKHEVRLISNLEVDWSLRRKGHASELLSRVAAEADKKKVILILNPGAFGDIGPDTEQLVEWYASLGYQEIQQEPRLMARMFNIPQVIDAATKITSIILEGSV